MGINVNMSRRSFVKVAAATGLGAALAQGASTRAVLADAAPTEGTAGEVSVIRTACRGCGKMECGVLVTVENGRAVKIEGDPSAFQSFGNCCSKSQASLQACYHPDRMRYPMKRTNPKDNDDPGWVRITWQEAVDTIAEKIEEIREAWGGYTMITYTGTSRIWSMQGNAAFGGMFGTPNNLGAWQICKGPRHFVSTMQSEFAWSWMETVTRPRVFVQWGGQSEMSNYDDSCRTTVDAATKADVHIAVDPRMSNLGKEADYWLNLRPGTDGALSLAWASVVVSNDLYDAAYIKKWTNAPFLVVKDMEPTEAPLRHWMLPSIRTRLLKESDLMEGGKSTRFMVWDELGDKLTWFDADPEVNYTWEGETWKPQEKGFVPELHNLLEGVDPGWVCDLSGFTEEDGFATPIEPALYGEFEVTLKDGTVHKARPVWDYYAERLQDYTPEKVAEICDLPASLIEESALAYATRLDPASGFGNGGLQYMLANEHYGQAAENCRCHDILTGITGNYDTPGGMRGSTRAPIGMDCGNIGPGLGMATQGRSDPTKKLGMEHRPMFMWWPMWGDACYINDAMYTGDPYPIRGGMCQSGDFMNMANSLHNWAGLQKTDFFFTVDLWFTPITGISDIVLPCHHWLEVNAPRRCQGASGAYGCNIRCVDPPGETVWDPVVAQLVAWRLGLPWNADPAHPYPWDDGDDPFSLEAQKKGEWAVLDLECAITEQGNWDGFAADFQEHGWFDAKLAKPYDFWGHYRRFEVGQARRGMPFSAFKDVPSQPGFGTPTAKHEIWSTVMETCRPNEDRELTRYFEPIESPRSTPELFEKYPFLCMTGRRIPVYFHNEHRQLPWCRELWPTPRVEINPADAAELGIEQGDWVWIENDRGKIRQTADLYYGVKPGMINCEHQWWFPELKQASKGFELSGANCLVDPLAADPDTGASMVRGYAVKIYKATSENSPNGNPVPCGNDGTPIIADASDARLKAWLPVYGGEEATS
jgi:anaerobic selenocysteine-containing dehydrogenase